MLMQRKTDLNQLQLMHADISAYAIGYELSTLPLTSGLHYISSYSFIFSFLALIPIHQNPNVPVIVDLGMN